MTDKYTNCKKCGGALFPWERNSDTCGGCILSKNYRKSVEEDSLYYSSQIKLDVDQKDGE